MPVRRSFERQGLLTALNRQGLTGPVIAVVAGIVALVFLHRGAETSLVVDAEGFGPASWPRVMLCGFIAAGLLWGLVRWRSAAMAAGEVQTPQTDNLKLLSGGLAVILYGVAIVYLGFAFATFGFLVTWFLLGGLRRPLPVIANSVLGTLALLYLFLRVAYLPLPRGEGFMDTLTVNLYRLLGIF